jgi:hypothetical protein
MSFSDSARPSLLSACAAFPARSRHVDIEVTVMHALKVLASCIVGSLRSDRWQSFAHAKEGAIQNEGLLECLYCGCHFIGLFSCRSCTRPNAVISRLARA